MWKNLLKVTSSWLLIVYCNLMHGTMNLKFSFCVYRFGVQLVNMWSECISGIFSPSGAVAVRSYIMVFIQTSLKKSCIYKAWM
jgi:hypothetical protein